jgi:hypothetical protein
MVEGIIQHLADLFHALDLKVKHSQEILYICTGDGNLGDMEYVDDLARVKHLYDAGSLVLALRKPTLLAVCAIHSSARAESPGVFLPPSLCKLGRRRDTRYQSIFAHQGFKLITAKSFIGQGSLFGYSSIY